MTDLLTAVACWPTVAVAVLVLGFLPGAVLRLVVRAFPPADPRRRELIAELYAVPRWERPFWVAQQLEVAVFEGFGARLAETYDAAMRRALGRVFRSQVIRSDLLDALDSVPRRRRPVWVFSEIRDALSVGWRLESGVELHRTYPETFWIPTDAERSSVRPGDTVKLCFRTSDGWGERMWVSVRRVRGDRCVGALANDPVGIPRLRWGSRVDFGLEHVIDIDRPANGVDSAPPATELPPH